MPKPIVLPTYPFYSATIPPTGGKPSVPAATSLRLDVDPPTGEKWLIYVFVDWNLVEGNNCAVSYYDDIADTYISVTGSKTGGTYGEINPKLAPVPVYITPDLRLELFFYNAQATAQSCYWGYSGFKLSTPSKSFGYVDVVRYARFKSIDLPLPLGLEALDKYKVEAYDIVEGRYKLAVFLEKDVPVVIDEATKYPVVRRTVTCYVDDLLRMLGTIRADPAGTGWKKYLDMWASEGIYL